MRGGADLGAEEGEPDRTDGADQGPEPQGPPPRLGGRGLVVVADEAERPGKIGAGGSGGADGPVRSGRPPVVPGQHPSTLSSDILATRSPR